MNDDLRTNELRNDSMAIELREDAVLMALTGESIINSIDRNNEFLLFYNIDELLSVAKRIHVIGRAYKKKLEEQKSGNGRHG